MIVFPPAKINLGLNIIRKREDGFHDLETVFVPAPVNDVLEIIIDHSIEDKHSPIFSSSGLQVQGPASENICVQAYQLLKKDFPQLPPVRIHLHKRIPMGAGLGGGSSDGAYTLMLLNRIAALNLSTEALLAYALTLGSDCPFFIQGKACFASGRGEKMEPVDVHFEGYQLVLVYPGIHISTAMAFRGIHPKKPSVHADRIVEHDPVTWTSALHNDFEETIFPLFPAIKQLKEALYHAGAIYASMSGSGSTVFGIFPPGTTPDLIFPDTYQVFRGKL